MERLIFRICICCLISLVLIRLSNAQDQIVETPAISKMMNAFKERNQNIENFKVWRIQIEAFTDRREMELEKIKFERSFPYYRLEWEHDDPYYILKVKNMYFLRKLDALFVLNQIKDRYPQSILTIDYIPSEDLLKSVIF